MWEAFTRLSARRRPSSAGLAPIGFLEIEAFNRLTLSGLSAWDVDLITQLDTAVLKVAGAHAPGPSAADQGNKIPASNVIGIRAMLRSKAAERKAAA